MSKSKYRGFTLIEILIVIAIIGILATIIIVFLNSARVSAKNSERTTDVRTIKTGLEMYANDHGGNYPSTMTGGGGGGGTRQTYGLNPCASTGIVGRTDWIPGIVSGGYISKLPSDPDGLAINTTDTTAGCNNTYMYTSDGKNYTLSNNIVTVSSDPTSGGGTSLPLFVPYITFDRNGGTGDTSTQTLDTGQTANLNPNTYSRTGYTFSGWSTSSSGLVSYADGASYTMTGSSNVTLYAVWIRSGITFVYNGSSVTYGTVQNPVTGKVWLDRNLGATRVALSATDSAAYGDVFQWGRAADGHQIRVPLSGATDVTSDSWVPGHSKFILASMYSYGNWGPEPSGVLWQGVSGPNNPCPTGFRLPTEAELTSEISSWDSQDSAGAFGSVLKLTLAGQRLYEGGSLFSEGSWGEYWTLRTVPQRGGSVTGLKKHRLENLRPSGCCSGMG